jgi:tetratricopeptide (TPR) repeat protein
VSDNAVELSTLGQQIDAHLAAGAAEQAAVLARLILVRLPRHLATYQRLLRAAWILKRAPEGEDWARRLLQADPGNAFAWRSLAYAVEQKGMRNAARAMWKRAFEADPYDPEIRSGLSRTSLEPAPALTLNTASLASLYIFGGRWAHAAGAYRALIQADNRRIDFQVNCAMALWQQNARQDAYRIARYLARNHPYLLMAWVVVNALGDVDDRALARNPIATMDPDGDFVRSKLGLPFAGAQVVLQLTPQEAEIVAA